jgi:C4-dicarboxylate-specific signal transduction histidine kinase
MYCFPFSSCKKKAQILAENMTVELRGKSLALEQTKNELEQKLNDLEMAQAKLIEASNLASLGEMAGGIAHEINNPLTIINGYLDRLLLLASRERLTAKEMNRLVSAAQKTVFRIRGIVNGLRNFSRDSQHESLTTARVGDIIEETMDLCREKFHNHAVGLKVDGALTTEICCRKLQISQVLINLLNNAYQAVLNAEAKEISIDGQEAGPDILIAVTDSGPGIPASLQHKMFQPFFTTKEVGQGTGLGLSISKGLIESQNGSLEFDPTSVRTRFIVRLPRTQGVRKSA